VQFHPESILTEHGKALLANFLQLQLRLRGAGEQAADSEPLAVGGRR
jgi:GMP synthase-like glutamine amidotransferase